MKKLYILFTFLLLTSLAFSQTASITKVIESSCSAPFLKTVEIAVTGTIDFATDNIQLRYSSNGNGFDPSGDNSAPNLIDISGLGIQTNTYVYLIRDLTLMQTEFPSGGITTANSIVVSTSTNGDDAYQLTNSDGTVISQYGVDLEDGSNMPWEHTDTYAERNTGTTETGTFVIGDWTVYAEDLLDTYGVCAKSSTVTGDLFETIISLKSWKTLSSIDFTSTELSIYPNPANGLVTIKSTLAGEKNIELFDITGRRVTQQVLESETLDLKSINPGMYLLKVSIENRSSVTKLIVE